jgi:hypothetical protein
VITASTKQTIFYKLRDKFTFKVGAGLTIYNVIFDATDSISLYDESGIKEVWANLVKDTDPKCTLKTGVIEKCDGKVVSIPR